MDRRGHESWQAKQYGLQPERCEKPHILSHSNPIALFPHPRNITDEQIRKVAERGGVVGACAFPPIHWDQTDRRPGLETFLDSISYFADLVGVNRPRRAPPHPSRHRYTW